MKEKILSRIELKYYKTPDKRRGDVPSGIKCSWCFEPNITKIGAAHRDEKGNIHNVCERCAILDFKERESFKTIKAATARRRRLFDVGYLFNEMVIDKYMEVKNIEKFEDLENAEDIFIKSSELYNHLFSKEDKVKLEEVEYQDNICSQLKEKISIVNFPKFFEGL